MENLKHIIESLVFVSETPLSIDRLKTILDDVDRRDIRLALAELQGEYEDRQGGFVLQEVAGGFQFRTHADYSDWIKKLLKPSPTRLSRAALETLAIIAYKQPIIRADVEHIRGVDSGGVLRMLLERKLIRVLGRKDIPGRPMIYGTTKEFLELFNLKDLGELPSPKEISSLGLADGDEDIQLEDASQLAALSTVSPDGESVSPETGFQTDSVPASQAGSASADPVDAVAPSRDEDAAGSDGAQDAVPDSDDEDGNLSQLETARPSETPETDPDQAK
ncbi:MAG: SMC-Scp complex subunit ScpB [Desulfobacterales bacterium]|nr:SMC-Scp complex subunit ScpB [Desulfobacterales bacterium]